MRQLESLRYHRQLRKIATTFLIFCLAAHAQDLKQVSSSLAAKIDAAGRKKVAVVDFTDLQGNVTELGRFLAEELSGTMAEDAHGFRVVDRTHLKTILQEHKLASTGLIDPQTARQLGRITGVDTLVTGTITSAFGESVRVSAKALDVETAEIIAQARADIPKTKAIEELLGRGIGSGSEASGTTTPPPRPINERPQTQIKKEDGFSFELKSCQQAGSTVTCKLLVTSEADDEELALGARGRGASRWVLNAPASKMFDQTGNEYIAESARLGNQAATEWTVTARLVRGIPTGAAITFGRIAEDATRIALLEIGCSHKQNDRTKTFVVQMRNVPLGR